MKPDPHDERADRSEPMDESSCLYVLSLLMDGRPVEEDLARAARAYAQAHPHCERVLAEWQSQAHALASLPARQASPGFTERVLAAAAAAGSISAAGAGGSTGSTRLAGATGAAGSPREIERLRPFARQLALAASVALLLSLVFTLARPAALRADAGIARHRHAVDGFRASPFLPDDIPAGLRARLADAEFGARLGAGALR